MALSPLALPALVRLSGIGHPRGLGSGTERAASTTLSKNSVWRLVGIRSRLALSKIELYYEMVKIKNYYFRVVSIT